MNTALLKSLLPGLVSYSTSGAFEVVDSPAYLRLVDQREDTCGDEYCVEYIGRQISANESTPIKVSESAVARLRARCDAPGGHESEQIPALGFIWLPSDKAYLGFCVLPLEMFDSSQECFGVGEALNIASGHFYLNTKYLDDFLSGKYPSLAAGKVSIEPSPQV